MNLSAERVRAEATKLAGAVEYLAAQREELAQRLAESTRMRRDTQVRLWLDESPAVARPARPGRPPADVDPAKVTAWQDQLRHFDGQCRALTEDLKSTTAQWQEAQQRLATADPHGRVARPEEPSAHSSQAMTPATPATPVTPKTPAGAQAPGAVSPTALRAALYAALGAEPARRERTEVVVHAAQPSVDGAVPLRAQATLAGAAAATDEAPAALSDPELRLVHQALRHEGAAVTRLVRRMRLEEPRSRVDKLRAKVQKAPRPLEGERLQHFEDRVLKDLGVLAKKGDLSPLQAADLMRRAVNSRTLGSSLSAPARDQLLLALEGARRTHAPGIVKPPSMPEGSPAQAGITPRTQAINKLASGLTIDLTDHHEASIATLDPGQVADLLAALGLGAPSEDELRFNEQKQTAADLIKRPFSSMRNNAAARQASLGQDLPKDMLERLDKAAEIANAVIGVTQIFNPDPLAPPTYKLEFRFNGSQNFKDTRQNLRTAVGGVGPVYQATDTVAEIMAQLFKEHGHKYQIDMVFGVSLGGGAAQAFLAGLESRTPLRVSPPMVLLDPQLLNDAQAQSATRHGAYDFQKPRGVAISLDYPHKPRKGLMDIMKGPGGYRHPGLMQIKLGLTQGDGPDRGKNTGKPKSMPLGLGLNLGYHEDRDQYARAIRRFTGSVGELSAAGVQALIANYDRRAYSPQPPQSEITPASPRQGPLAGSPEAPSVSLRERASTRALTGGGSGSLRPHGTQRPVTQDAPSARSDTTSPGLADVTDVARSLPPSPDPASPARGAPHQPPEPAGTTLQPSVGAGMDLPAQRQRAEAINLAGAVEHLAAQRKELTQRPAENTRLQQHTQAELWRAMPPATSGTPATPATPIRPMTPGGVSPAESRAALPAALAAGPAQPVSPGDGAPPALRERLETLVHATQQSIDDIVPLREQVAQDRAAVRAEGASAALSDRELGLLRSALPQGGAAVTRLARRTRLQEPRSMFDRVRAKVQKAPRPLAGERFERFMGMVLNDIAALAKKSGQPPLRAAELMQRAVDTGALGASLPTQEQARLSFALRGAKSRLAAGRPHPDMEARHRHPWAATAHASTALGELLAQDSPTPAGAKPKGVAINKLNSGLKINVSRQPDVSIANLQSQELNALFQALKLGAPKNGERELHDQKAQAKALLDGFCKKLWGLMTDAHAFHGPSAIELTARLPEETNDRLMKAAKIAHCQVHVSRSYDDDDWTAPPKMRLEILFGATQNMRDFKQDLKTAIGGRGSVYKATDEVAAILADEIRKMNGHVEIGFVSGLSMGGGTAQAFLAGLESRVQLPASPPLILLDPQLLNDAQSRYATRHGTLGYDFEKPRGIAISLDYDKAPRRGLMGIMKGPGAYKYPGLLHLKLGLKDTDGPKGGKPLIMPPGLGYHGDSDQYLRAIRRFTSDLGESPPASPPPSFGEASSSGSEGPGSPVAGLASFRDWENEVSASARSDRSGPSGV